MAEFPEARTDGVVTATIAGMLVVRHADGREIARLDPLTAGVWRLADGRTPVPVIARSLSRALGVPVDDEAVWSALDALGDAGLIGGRVTPPAMGRALTRRDLLHAGVAGGIAGIAAAPFPARAATEEQNQKAAERSYKNEQQRHQQEQTFKRNAQEQNAKASNRGAQEAQEQMRKDSQRRQEQNSKRQEQNGKAQERASKPR